jgi:aminoglycoside phosphotransferase (APT) family kinase protein
MALRIQTETGVIVAPQVRDFDVFSRTLTQWLAAQMPQARDLRIENLTYPRGSGQSHETILLDALWRENGAEKAQGFVVRIKPTAHTVYQDDMFEEQHRVMRAMRDSGRVRVAQIFWVENDASVLGAPFFVMEKIEGRVAVSVPPYSQTGWVVDATPAQRATLWDDGVRQLAAIQSVNLDDFAFLDRPQDGATGFDQELARWRRLLDWISEERPLPFQEFIWSTLNARLPANKPPGVVWGDARLGNLLIGADYKVAAVMDWEQPSLGGALHDLAWWTLVESGHLKNGAPLEGLGRPEDTVKLWGEVTGISTADYDWYLAFAAFKMSCLSVRMLDLSGSTPPNGYADTPLNRRLAEMLGLEWSACGV